MGFNAYDNDKEEGKRKAAARDVMQTKGPSEQQAYANGYADGYAAAIRERDLGIKVSRDDKGRALWRDGPAHCSEND